MHSSCGGLGSCTFAQCAQNRRDGYNARAIVLHEIVHTLGFTIWTFQNILQAGTTATKDIVEVQSFTDTDGTTDAGVWAVISERTVDVARRYYNCSSLTSMPLMGENQLGDGSRGSHWETRLMNDEFMAYGEGSMVSDFTLALMEDLGLYLANYSTAACMFWGRAQGCDFVSSRCGTRRDDGSLVGAVPVVSADAATLGITTITQNGGQAVGSELSCGRDYPRTFGTSGFSGNPVMKAKCANPNCGRTWPTGPWTPPGLGASTEQVPYCNLECWQVSPEPAINVAVLNSSSLESCGQVPPGAVVAAADESTTSFVSNAKDTIMSNPKFFGGVFCGMMMFAILLFCCCCRMKHYHPLRVIFLLINTCTMITGAAMLGIGFYAYVNMEVYTDFYGITAVRNGTILGGIVTAWGLFGYLAIYAVRRDHFSVLFLYILVLSVVIVFQTACALMVVIWVFDSYTAETNLYRSVGEHGSPVVTGVDFMDEAVEDSILSLETMACTTYRRCCWLQQQETLNRTSCTAAHGGAGVGAAAVSMSDPSSEDFCELITGVTADSKVGKLAQVGSGKSACIPFQTADIVDLEECGLNFCREGVKGFESFVGKTFQWVRDNLVWFSLFLAIFGVGESVLFCTCVALFCLHARGVPDHIRHGSSMGLIESPAEKRKRRRRERREKMRARLHMKQRGELKDGDGERGAGQQQQQPQMPASDEEAEPDAGELEIELAKMLSAAEPKNIDEPVLLHWCKTKTAGCTKHTAHHPAPPSSGSQDGAPPLPEWEDLVTDLETSFYDGTVFCALIHNYRPGLLDYSMIVDGAIATGVGLGVARGKRAADSFVLGEAFEAMTSSSIELTGPGLRIPPELVPEIPAVLQAAERAQEERGSAGRRSAMSQQLITLAAVLRVALTADSSVKAGIVEERRLKSGQGISSSGSNKTRRDSVRRHTFSAPSHPSARP